MTYRSERQSARRLLLAAGGLAGLALTICGGATAQSTTTPAQPTPTPTPATQSWVDRVTFKGYLQLDGIFPEGNAAIGSSSNFRIRRARPTMVIQADPLTKVQVQMDFSTGKTGAGAATASVADTYVEHLFPKLGYALGGQNLLPFGREIKEDNAAVRSPLELSYAAESFACSERDLGVFFRSTTGEEDRYHWETAFVNGQGWRTADTNSNKTWIGRFTYKFNPYLRVGASQMVGTFMGNGKSFDRHVTGYEFVSSANKAIKLSGEYYNVKFVDSLANPTKAADYHGGYLLYESYIGSLKSIPFVRYQRTYGDLDYRSFDFGWRYQYAPLQRITLEYDVVAGHQRNMFGARWQVGF